MGVNNPGINIFAGVPAPGELKITGRVFYVGNSSTYVPGGVAGVDDPSQGDTPQRPFATLDYAVGQCTASRGDVIYILPGHAETIATATALALDVAGIQIYGLGDGALRPTFTVNGAATATITVSAANVTWKNCIVVGGLDGLNTAITVTGAQCTLDVEYQDTSASVEADIAIACSGDKFTCTLRDVGFAGGDQRDQSITLNGVDNARIDIDFYGKVGTAVVDMITAACTDVEVRGTMYVSGTTDGSKNVVDTIGSSTWYMDVIDAAAGARYTGGSAAAVASDDISALNTKIGTITNTGGTATIGAVLGDLANDSLVARLNDIGSNVDGTTTDTIQGKLGTDTELADRSLYDILNGGGPVTAATAAAPANDVSLYGAVRWMSQQQVMRIATHTKADVTAATAWTTANSPVTIFTVTGAVLAQVFAVVTTNMTSTGANGTLEIGIVGNTAALAVQDVVDGSAFQQNDCWSLTTAADNPGAQIADEWFFIGNGEDIVVTIATNNMSAGGITVYCRYIPVTSGATVVTT